MKDNKKQDGLELATLGGGCFWCIEAVFEELQGVDKVVSGYAGGDVKNPAYKEICTGRTNHAEVVQITFDSKIIRFDEILEVFFHVHDPTTLNRQGADVGTQYRSVIFYHNDAQKAAAEKSKATTDKSDLWKNPIVTEISPMPEFYTAEEYHQEYFKNNPNQPYCSAVVGPKVQKFRKKFKDRLKKEVAE